MLELLLIVSVLGLLLSPQILAGLLAKKHGKKSMFWFGISFIIPFISLFILVYLKDKNPDKSYKLADHVKRG